ncbi:uncharacterized protein LOC121939816, partial [Plectropomus leopardus]|uniref:uncharacterized protein LOC121939816 n=1 Tax=Plectropomus leopardus TaxID=160734 RepID=UPI001C4C032A
MSSGPEGGGGRRVFLSAHRCPEVDLLPHDDCDSQIPLPCSHAPAELTCNGPPDTNYLDISSTCCSEEQEEQEEEGSISDWSEEDLSLHFPPSVIVPSDESDPESGYECVDVNMDTQVRSQEGEGLKMVPKRLIQLKKKKDAEKLQVILRDGPDEGGGVNIEVSANKALCPTVRHCPDLLLRQNSMPASLHTRVTTSSDVDSYRVYRGLVAGSTP